MFDPVDPTPFEPFMPASVRAVVERARRGEGPAAQWLVSEGYFHGQVRHSANLLGGQVLARLIERMVSLRALLFTHQGLDLCRQLVGPFPRVETLGFSFELPTAPLPGFPNVRMLAASASRKPPGAAIEGALRLGVSRLLLFSCGAYRDAIAAFDASSLEEARFTMGGGWDVALDTEGWCLRLCRDGLTELSWSGGKLEKGHLAPMLEVLAESGRRTVTIALPRLGRAHALEEVKHPRLEIRTDGTPLDPYRL